MIPGAVAQRAIIALWELADQTQPLGVRHRATS